MTDKPKVRATVERVKAIRIANECSLMEAHRLAMREALATAIDNAETIDDLKAILRTIAERWI